MLPEGRPGAGLLALAFAATFVLPFVFARKLLRLHRLFVIDWCQLGARVHMQSFKRSTPLRCCCWRTSFGTSSQSSAAATTVEGTQSKSVSSAWRGRKCEQTHAPAALAIVFALFTAQTLPAKDTALSIPFHVRSHVRSVELFWLTP